MASTDRPQVLREILGAAVLPVFHHSDGGAAEQILNACGEAGAPAAAFEVRGPHALRLFADLAARPQTKVTLGAGAVTDVATADAAIDAGAAFVWAALFDEAIARRCNRRRVAHIPTCADLHDVARAEELGAEIVALRPAGGGDLAAVRALLQLSPQSRFLVTDGQAPTAERTRAWIDTGVAALGLGSETLTDKVVAEGSDAVRAAIARVRGWVRRARGEKLFQGVEHVGLYEHQGASAADITAWYRDTFEWDVEEGRAYYFAAGDGPGRIEIMKVGQTDRCHLAIKVADLEEATAYLKTKGIELVPPETRPDGRKIFFTVTDPAGNILHLLP